MQPGLSDACPSPTLSPAMRPQAEGVGHLDFYIASRKTASNLFALLYQPCAEIDPDGSFQSKGPKDQAIQDLSIELRFPLCSAFNPFPTLLAQPLQSFLPGDFPANMKRHPKVAKDTACTSRADRSGPYEVPLGHFLGDSRENNDTVQL